MVTKKNGLGDDAILSLNPQHVDILGSRCFVASAKGKKHLTSFVTWALMIQKQPPEVFYKKSCS